MKNYISRRHCQCTSVLVKQSFFMKISTKLITGTSDISTE